jgi:LuxR family maltose regulon positive regulatory protein
LIIKHTFPRQRRHWIRRPRLFEALAGWRELTLIQIIAPVGYGKTTLGAMWLNSLLDTTEADAPTAIWLTLNPEDDDPQLFLHHIGDELQAHFPTLGDLFPLIDARQITVPQLLRAVFREIGAASQPCILVLDDYHLIDDAATHDLTQSILSHAPQNFHLVLLSRTTPPLHLHRLFLENRVAMLDEQALRFDHDEFDRFVDAFPNKITGEQRAAMETQGQGWIAVLHLLLHAAAADRRTPHTAPHSRAMLDDFVESEIVAALPDDLLRFLIDTSLLPIITPELAATTTQQPLAVCEQFLRRAAASIFVAPVVPALSSASEPHGVRVHPLLRDRLRYRLTLAADAARVHGLRTRAAARLAQQGDIDAALTLLTTEEKEQATDIVAVALRPALWRLDLEPAHRWLRHLPDALIDAHPQLARDAAWLSFLRETADFHSRVERAAAHDGDPDGEIAVLQSLSLYFQGRHPEARDTLDAAAGRIQNDTIAGGYAHLVRGLSLDKGTSIELRMTALTAAKNSFRNAGFMHGTIFAVTLLGAIHAIYGDSTAALANYDHALVMLHNEQLGRSSIAAEVRCARGDLLFQLNRIDAARADYVQAAIDSDFMRYHAQLGEQLCNLAQKHPIHFDLDADTLTWSEIVTSRNLNPQIGWMRTLREIMLNRPHEAWKTIEHFGIQPSQLRPEMPDILWLSVLAGNLCSGRHLELLAVLLPQFRDRMYASRHLPIALRAHVLCALFQLHQRNQTAALEELRAVLPAIEASGLRRFVDDFDALRPLLAQCLDLSKHVLPFGISPQEARVLALLAAGRSTEEIAAELVVSLATVRAHVKKSFAKLGVHHRAAAIHVARKAGIV